MAKKQEKLDEKENEFTKLLSRISPKAVEEIHKLRLEEMKRKRAAILKVRNQEKENKENKENTENTESKESKESKENKENREIEDQKTKVIYN